MSLITKQSVDAKGPWSLLVCPAGLGGGKVTPAPSITETPTHLASVCSGSAAMPRRPGSWSSVLGAVPAPPARPAPPAQARGLLGAHSAEGAWPWPAASRRLFRVWPSSALECSLLPLLPAPSWLSRARGRAWCPLLPRSALLVPPGPRPPQLSPAPPRGAPAAPLCLCSGPSDNSVPSFRSVCFGHDFHGRCVRP